MNKLIELKNLTKNFDDQQVLRGINLDIYENEFLMNCIRMVSTPF